MLIERLTDINAGIRLKASRALAAIGRPAVADLQAALRSPDPDIRKNAAFCLGEIGTEASPAVPALKQLLNDEHTPVRWCADNALKKILTPRD
jgi:HEAT repeat protein